MYNSKLLLWKLYIEKNFVTYTHILYLKFDSLNFLFIDVEYLNFSFPDEGIIK